MQKNLPIWDPNLPIWKSKSPYLGPSKKISHIYMDINVNPNTPEIWTLIYM